MENNKDTFRIKFRGVRGSYPTPDKRFLKYGGNTSCVEVRAGNHLIILDGGTGIISLGQELFADYIGSSVDVSARKPMNMSILLSHIHSDHIQGINFFQPINVSSTKINMLGYSGYEEPLADSLSELLYGKSFPVNMSDIQADVDIFDIFESDVIIIGGNSDAPVIKRQTAGANIDFSENDIKITCMKSSSHPQNGVMLYKIEYKGKSVVYATDKENYVGSDKRLAIFARKCDLLIHDAQYTDEDYLSPVLPKQGFGHSTFEMAVELAKIAQVKNLAFFHLDPFYDDAKLDEIESHYSNIKNNCFIAKEGQEIVLL